MKENTSKFIIQNSKKIAIAMSIIFAISLIFIIIIGLSGNKTTNSSNIEDFAWNENWLLEDGEELSLPYADKENDSLSIYKTLPEKISSHDALVFSSGYQPIEIEVDGQKIPVIGSFDGKIVYATAYSYISLTPEMAGKEIKVTFLNKGNKAWMEIYNIKLGDLNLIRQQAFKHNSASLISAGLLIIASIFVFILALFLRKSAVELLKTHTQPCLLGSILAIMFAFWMLADTEFIALIFGDNPAYVFVNIFSYLFIIGPWLTLVMITTQKSSLWMRILAMSGLIEICVIILGIIFGIFPYSIYLMISHILCFGALVVTLYLSLINIRKNKNFRNIILFITSIIMLLLSSVTAYSYYFLVSANNISFLKYGIYAFVIVMIVDQFVTFRNINKSYMLEVEAARLAAENANHAKSDFLSSMSHDIRTPMNAIMGLTTIAAANIDNKDTVKDSLRKISISSRHLLGLINDILDMSKIESGKISLTISEISLNELIENLLNIIQPQIKSRQQKFEIILENVSSENIYCDGIRLSQILLNILSNAVKYTQEKGSIYVSVKQEDSPKGENFVRTIFSISDNGIGMSPEFLEHIFDSFSRDDKNNIKNIEGTGLGMSITKHIVDMMGGTITVDSRLNEGSTFTVTLDFERISDENQNLFLPPLNTLVVDDDKQLCLSAVETLKEIGITADYTQNGIDAINMVVEKSVTINPYHIVLLDWQMPNIDGIETARRIRKQVGEDVPILLITAYDWRDIEKEAREAGINGFLSKPLFKSTLRYGLMKYFNDVIDEKETIKEDISTFTGKRILISEDNDINWEIAQTILSSNGFIVERAEDGIQCLEMFEKSEIGYYDIILMDIRMPRMNGYDSTKAIRLLTRNDAKTIPILAMTADAFNEDIQQCLSVGMNGHISKPLDFKNLLKLIENNIK